MNNDDENPFSWIEEIHQKLEAVRMEAENQVLSATDSIMNFCSHAMEDLLPPVSDDPMTPEYYPALCSAHNFYPGMSDKAEIIIRRNYLNSVKNSELNASGKFGNSSNASAKKYREDEIASNDDDTEGVDVPVSEQQLSNLSLVNECVTFSAYKPVGYDETERNSDDYQRVLDIQLPEQKFVKLSLDASDNETGSNSDDNEGLDARICDESESIPTAHIKSKLLPYKKRIRDLNFSSESQMHQETDCSSQRSAKIADSISINLNSDSMESDWEIL